MNQDQLKKSACAGFALSEDRLEELEGTDSLVFATEKIILKITPEAYRSNSAVQAEIDVVNFFAARGLPVARALPSPLGKFCLALEGFSAAMFERLNGTEVDEEDTSRAMLERWGVLLGQLHAAATQFKANPNHLRHQWFEEALITHLERHVPTELQSQLQQANQLLERIHTFPKDESSYGIIHADFHSGNMLEVDGILHAIDFCDCRYHWFAFDIARAMYAAMPSLDEASDFAPHFMTHFMHGYKHHHQLEPAQLALIPDFFRLHDLEQLGMMYVPSFLTGEGLEWTPRLLESRAKRWARLTSDVGLLDSGIDFSSFA